MGLPAISDGIPLERLGQMLAASGYFQDTREAGQAVVKVLAGSELGFGPIASMTGINIIKGKVSLSAGLIASAVKRSGRYNFRVTVLSEERCSITFFDGKENIGISEFTINDAKQAGLLQNAAYSKFPRNMLYARAISNGARWFCPDVFGGPVYTPDELGEDVDEDGEMTINAKATESTRALPEPDTPKEIVPDPPAKTAILDRHGLVVAIKAEVTRLGWSDTETQERLVAQFGKPCKEMTPEEMLAVLDWLRQCETPLPEPEQQQIEIEPEPEPPSNTGTGKKADKTRKQMLETFEQDIKATVEFMGLNEIDLNDYLDRRYNKSSVTELTITQAGALASELKLLPPLLEDVSERLGDGMGGSASREDAVTWLRKAADEHHNRNPLRADVRTWKQWISGLALAENGA